ncbi:hypothetical protein I4I78_11385 [Pseudonocardia sp. KRD-291]|nr:hypothetical protein [Pseudonocardia sp. KRD291]
MWEARARAGSRDALLAWVRERVPLPGAHRTEVFVASQDRVVVIALGPDPARLPDPPEELVSRPPHAWPFTRVEVVGQR